MKKTILSISRIISFTLLIPSLLITLNSCSDDSEDQIGDYSTNVGKLLSGGEYKSDDVNFSFKYKQDEIKAKEIRDYFKLDTIVSQNESTWEKTIKIAKFVASNIKHDNPTTVFPKHKNAISIWEYIKEGNAGVNCRYHSIMMYDLLMSEGITTRYINCISSFKDDNDSHVVNIVWLPEMNKWAMIDSDMKAYITDKNNVPLSIQEIRERMINKGDYKIVPLFDTDFHYEYYNRYLAKNFYMLSCWEESMYDKECFGNNNDAYSVFLIPNNFIGTEFYTEIKNYNKNKLTTDEDRFWAKP